MFSTEKQQLYSAHTVAYVVFMTKRPFETASLLTQLSHYKLLQNNAAKAQ